MREQLIKFISETKFPCVMAKSVINKGFLSVNEAKNIEEDAEIDKVLAKFYDFVDEYRKNPEKLSSFILTLPHADYGDLDKFDSVFWKFLDRLRVKDREKYAHDPRVSSDPNHPNFSYSIKEEAFFILVLHPKSPRFARRFSTPTIVFNPHQQFEGLRSKGLFKKVRDLIRKRDELLQGFINPMLLDFGEKSEVFQYMGIKYSPSATSPLTA
jgi:FPC/CPF motif-containing protein YcgG